ncbi:DUF1491 family protein [Sphingomonas jatrophae]
MLVSALIRRVEAAGGHAMVLAKGDAGAGAVLLVLAERGQGTRLVERMPALDGGQNWIATGPTDLSEPGALSDYIARRRRSDPDLWAVELDVADAERIAAEVLG